MENLQPPLPGTLALGDALVGENLVLSADWENVSNHFVDLNTFDPLETPDHAFYVGGVTQPVRLFSGQKSPAYSFTFQPPAGGPFANRFTPVTVWGTARPLKVTGVGVWFQERAALQLGRFLTGPVLPLDCGVVPIGEAGTADFDVTNSSAAAIDVAFTWKVGQYFSMSAPPATLPPGARVDPTTGVVFIDVLGETLTVIFIPTRSGTARDILTIADPTGATRVRIVVEGTGVSFGEGGCLIAPGVAMSASGASNTIDFGDVIVGQTVRRAFFVTSGSDLPIFVRSRLLGEHQGFAIQIPAPANQVIPPRDQLGFVLSFRPPAVGAFADARVIADDTHQHYVARRVIGRGVGPML